MQLTLVLKVLQEMGIHLVHCLLNLAHVVILEAASLYQDLIQIRVLHPLLEQENFASLVLEGQPGPIV